MKAQKAQKIVLFFCHFSNMFLSYFRGLGKSLSRDTLEHKTPHPFSSSPSPPPVRSYLGSRVKRDLSFVRLVTKLTSAAQSKLLTIVGRIIRATDAKGPTLCGFYLMLLNPSVEQGANVAHFGLCQGCV